MPPFKLAAPIAAAMLACAPTVAWADVPCPSNRASQPDSPPIPTITSYTVTRATAPAGERESGSHEATVIGGDPVEGEMRIDIRLSSDLPRNCPLLIWLVDTTAPESVQRVGGGDVARIFGIVPTDAASGMPSGRAVRMVNRTLNSDGDNRLVLRAFTRGEFGDHTARLGLAVENEGRVYPFTLVRRGLPDLQTTLSANTTRFGSTVQVTAVLPFNAGSGMIDEFVTFAVTPASAGNFRRPNDLQRQQPMLDGRLDPDLNPRRAVAIFVPAATDKRVQAKITATLMGRTDTLPVTILPVPTPCKPVAEWTIGKGKVDLKLSNVGELPCPELLVSLSAGGLAIAGSSQRSSLIFASPEPVEASPLAARMLARPAASPPANPAQPTSWTGSFPIAGPYPDNGFTVTASVRPSDGSFPPITLPPFTVDRISIVKGR